MSELQATTVALEDPRWRELIASHPETNPFHLPEWSSVIADCYRFDASVLAICDGDELVGGVPVVAVRLPFASLRWVSLPFTDSCAPLLRPGVPLEAATDAMKDLMVRTGASEYELRAELPECADVRRREIGYRHLIALGPDPDTLKPNKGHRYSRNRAIRDGVRVVMGTSEDELMTFYRLHTLTRRKHGVPVQPLKFFRLLHERMISRGLGVISTAWHGDEVLAAGVYLTHNETVIAKYHASDPAKANLGAGYVVDWDTMVATGKEGYRQLDMGRSDAGAEGLRLYKASWGAEESPLVYSSISTKEAPAPKLTGSDLSHRIVQRSPVWVCRTLGEVLYRWTA